MERANKEVMRYLRESVYEINSIDKWEHWLPLVMSKINTTRHEALGVAPYKLIYGSILEPDLDILAPVPNNHYADRLSHWVLKHLEIIRILNEKAQASQQRLDTQHLLSRETGKRTEFEPNSHVLARYRGGLSGNKPPTKLHTSHRGPLKVIRYKDNEYALQNLVNPSCNPILTPS